jgi:hypothetical protein
MLKYRDLTQEQKEKICNGCGSKGGFIKPPNFIFKASCNHHDFNYWRGNTKELKKKADKDFYNAMKLDIAEAAFYKKPFYHCWALTYYISVSMFGKKYFYFADSPKGLKDL